MKRHPPRTWRLVVLGIANLAAVWLLMSVACHAAEAPKRYPWKAAAASYGLIVGSDYYLTQRCLSAGTCVEANPLAQTAGRRVGLAVGMFGAAMAADWLTWRYVRPRATWALRVGILGSRVAAHADVSF